MAELTPEQKAMVRKIRRQTTVIGVLTLGLIAALFQIYFTNNKVEPETKVRGPKYTGPVHDRTANTGLTNYNNTMRRTVLGSYKGVWFDTTDMRKYLDEKLPAIIQRHTTH